MSPLSDAAAGQPPAGRFASTHWSLVVAARDRASPQAREALASLCRAYWYPLYAFIRRQGNSEDQAADLTQEFFTRFLEKDFLQTVDRQRGKFRTFLLACCQHFLANQRDHDRAKKRGGDRPPLSLDFPTAAQRYLHEPAHALTAEKLFDRRWALTLLEQVLAQLGREFQETGKAELYDRLKIVLVGGPDRLSYAEIGHALSMTEAGVKKAAQRLRERYREVVREHIAATVDGPDQVEEEIRGLFAILGS